LRQATGSEVTEAWLAVAQPDGSPAIEIRVDVLSADELLGSLPAPRSAQTSRQLT
jgi:hypothetical protein